MLPGFEGRMGSYADDKIERAYSCFCRLYVAREIHSPVGWEEANRTFRRFMGKPDSDWRPPSEWEKGDFSPHMRVTTAIDNLTVFGQPYIERHYPTATISDLLRLLNILHYWENNITQMSERNPKKWGWLYGQFRD